MRGNVSKGRSLPTRIGGLEIIRFRSFDYFMILNFAVYALGISYWISFQTLGAVWFAVRWRRIFEKGLSNFPVYLWLVPAMYIAMFIEPSFDSSADLLHISREVLFFVLMVAFFNGLKHFYIAYDTKKADFYIRIIVILAFIMVAIQLVALARGIYIGIPKQFYVVDAETIPDKLTLRFTHVRPNAIWTEPSYLGYAMLSFMMMNQSFYRLGGTDRPVFALMILCGLMSQALSFVMFLIILLGLGVYTNKSMARYRTAVTVVGLVGVIVMIAVGGAGFVGDRLSKAGGASGDFSLFVRIFGPVGILPEYLRDHPLGVPFSDRLPALLAYTGQLGINPLEYTVNSITNFFYYGLVGGSYCISASRGATGCLVPICSCR
jgi:hypothetical protein